ncbi:chemotaxis-specific protein-glutamate methyltransferase CheB [bacterium]|nr:chemotaxis-specific protein-glutamate methyltransferase CheB [bacterium]
MAKIRVLVVEDSLTIRKRLIEVLAADPELFVVGEAADGKQAIELCQALRPDVVTLDMMMPVLSGLTVTEYVMGYCPTPILIVSASMNRGELFRTFDALAAGAVDVLEKPQGDELDERWEREFVSTVKLVSRIKVVTHPRARLGSIGRSAAEVAAASGPSTDESRWLVAIGASTGGPAAIAELLRSLPPEFPLPILLILHIGRPFESALVDWLDAQSGARVAYAKEGQALPRGPGVVLAPPDRHLVVREGRLRLTGDPERHSCRPSVDVLFESVAREVGASAIGCLLTGMGKDGARGLLAMKQARAITLAQDEASSVVFGMPREAILLGAADRVLPLREIAPALVSLAGSGASGRRA